MTPPLHASILRFWKRTDSGRTVAGTGFLAAGADGKTYALTCGHVANLVFGRHKTSVAPLASGTTVVDLFGNGEVTLDLAAWLAPPAIGKARETPVADIAVFVPREPFTAPFMPPLRIEPPSLVVPPGARVGFHSFGYMGQENGLPTGGALTAVDTGGWFVANGDDDFRRFIEEGLSGAPVYANGAVLGMVTQRLEPEAKQGLIIPAFALARAWPPLARPYPGLPAFDAATAHLYFGRGRPLCAGDPPTGKLKQLVDKLEAQRLVGLMGASGSGKSSLAKAGVALHYEQHGWTAIVFRPGLQPLRNFADAIVDSVGSALSVEERLDAAESWVKRLTDGNLSAALDAAKLKGAAGTLIVVDQLEEFFTATGDREADMARQRGIILPQLLAAVDRPDVLCLLTGRLDLMERMVIGDPVAAKMLSDPHPDYVLTAMSPGEVREAVEGPAGAFGVAVEPGFAADLAAEATRGEGRLPLLQAALRQAWSRIERTAEGWRMRRPALVGGEKPETVLDAALGERADAAVASLRRGGFERPGIAEDDLRRVLLSLVRIVDGVPARRIVARSETPATDWRILESLAAERLVTVEGEHGSADLVHEALMKSWPLLKGWIADEWTFLIWRDRFDREFTVWRDRGRKPEDLLRQQDVAIALSWMNVPHPGRAPPSADQSAYIAASDAHHQAETERQRRLLKRTQWGLAVAVLASTVALIFMFLSIATQRELEAALVQLKVRQVQAETAERVARKQAELATLAKNSALLQESRAITALAQQESRRGDQPTSMLLALEALPAPAFGGDRPLSADAEAALRQAWMRNIEFTLVGHTDAVVSGSFSPDGRRVVTASDDGTARVWDLSGPRPVATVLKGHTGPVVSASFSADGRRVVTASWDHTARVWDLSEPRPVVTVLEGHADTVASASFSADGRRVVTASWDHTARVWDLSGPRPVATVLEGHTGPVSSASFSADGRRVVTASNDNTARVWDLSGPRPVATVLAGHWGQVVSASFSADGRGVVTASNDYTALVWDLSGPHPVAPRVLEGHTGAVVSASFSADGRRVVTASWDKTARVWDLSGARPVPTVLEGHTGPVTSASFSADGRRIVTASKDETARVWDLSGPRPVPTVLEGHTGPVTSASFSADDRRVVTASYDGTAIVWEIYPDIAKLSALVIAHLSRCLSTAQRERLGLAVEDTSRPRDFIPPPDANGYCPR